MMMRVTAPGAALAVITWASPAGAVAAALAPLPPRGSIEPTLAGIEAKLVGEIVSSLVNGAGRSILAASQPAKAVTIINTPFRIVLRIKSSNHSIQCATGFQRSKKIPPFVFRAISLSPGQANHYTYVSQTRSPDG
jgi:hypothetical protein